MEQIISQTEILILIRLIVAHIVSDFILQPAKWARGKESGKLRSKYFYYHGLVTGAAAYLFLGQWTTVWIPLLIMFTHMLIDWWKVNARSGAKNFIIDQLLHLLVLVAAWLMVSKQSSIFWGLFVGLLKNYTFWIYLMGYLLVLFPAGILINISTQKWRNQLENRVGLEEAGKWIGLTERFLIVTFILINQYAAIGFLIAAKSIFRFNEIIKEKARKEAEYFLIGTLLSMAIALITGLMIMYLLHQPCVGC